MFYFSNDILLRMKTFAIAMRRTRLLKKEWQPTFVLYQSQCSFYFKF